MDFSGWLDLKDHMVAMTRLDRDALHIYAGIAIQLLTAALLRWRLSEWRTLGPLLLIELANEAADFAYDVWPVGSRLAQYVEAGRDLVNTLAVPILIMLIARRLSRNADEQATTAD